MARWMVHFNLAFNVLTYVGPLGTQQAMMLTPATRPVLLQQLGFGYWVHPNIRLQFTLQFAETLANVPTNRSAMGLMGAIPWVVFTAGPFFAGAGALLAWWSYNLPQFASTVGRWLEHEGVLRNHELHAGRFWDVHILALWRERFEQDRDRLLARITRDLPT